MKLHWSLAHLGLPRDADARAIKRAYAAKLKTTRPEYDPEGFQHLHEAYQAALSWVQLREADTDFDTDINEDIDVDIDVDIEAFAEDAPSGAMTLTLTQEALFDLLDAQPGEPAMPSPDASADRPATKQAVTDPRDEAARFDPEAFLDDCIAAAMRSHDSDLLAWLNAQPSLWSLAQKTSLAPWLLQRLHEQRPPVPVSCFDILAEFFGLLDLHSGYDAYTIHRLRHRLQLTWEIQTRQIRALAERTAQDGGSMAANLRQAGRVLRQLSRPVQWPQVLWAGPMPGYPSAVRSFLRRLDFGNLDDLPAPIREDQIAFWDAAGDRSRFSMPRWAVSVARLFVYTLAIAVVFALFSPIAQPESIYSQTSISSVIGKSFTAMMIVWLAYLAYDVFMRWQSLPESAPVRLPWLRAACIPMMGIGGLVADQWLDLGDGGMMISLAVFLLALQRYRRRNELALNTRLRFKAWHYIPFFFCLALLIWMSQSNPWLLSLGITVLALTLWALDMRTQRATLRN